jgi:histidyl-tRNA synthetase
MNLRIAITIGPEEAEKGQIAVKDLLSSEQKIVPEEAAAQVIKQILESK